MVGSRLTASPDRSEDWAHLLPLSVVSPPSKFDGLKARQTVVRNNDGMLILVEPISPFVPPKNVPLKVNERFLHTAPCVFTNSALVTVAHNGSSSTEMSRSTTREEREASNVVDDHPRTIPQAAAELSLSASTIRAWIAQQRLGCVRLGRALRVPMSEIRRVLGVGFVPAKSAATECESKEREPA